MIDGQRCVKITDFGIAKSFGSSSLTREGNVLGTMDFMAPEQARGEAVTARSDLFSMGAVLYSLLAGRPPFLQETAEKTFESLLSSRPPVRLDKIAKDTPAPLAALIHRLLEKDPARRLATAMAVSRQLQHVEEAIAGSLDADTQVVPADTNESAVQPGETFASGRQPVSGFDTGGADDISQTDTRITDAGELVAESIAKQPNYFNEVTPQQRRSDRAQRTEESRSRAWPLVVALLAVTGLAAYGIWHTMIRLPSAEELLATISESERKPTGVQDVLQLFQRIYPEHEQILYVNDLARYADAIRFRNTLQLKQKSPKVELTEVEKQFLEITGMLDIQSPEAIERMDAWLKFHGDSDLLSDSDAKVVKYADVYRARIRAEADRQIARGLEIINIAMQRAEQSSSTIEQLDSYHFIVEMYGDDKWASAEVNRCREKISELEQQKLPQSRPD